MRRVLAAVFFVLAAAAWADEPALPAGLGGGPALPSGLGDTPAPAAPVAAGTSQWTLTGFAELRYARRVDADPLQGDATLTEGRLHLEAEAGERIVVTLAADLLADAVDGGRINLRTGEGPLDLREATVFFRPLEFADVKLGRQVLTWGTGDLLFINDLFPKDFVSFFSGHDDDYRKAPAEALRVSLYSDLANLDLVALPAGATDRFVDGTRLSFSDPGTGAVRGSGTPLRVRRPDATEAAARLYRTFGGIEAALYGFWGRWKSPEGIDPATGLGTFPRLHAYGASIRGPLFGGIANLEAGYYDSRDDPDGTDPFTANSEVRALIGFEREIAPETTLGLQYATTIMLDHAAFVANLPGGAVGQRHHRDVATLRVTRLMRNQTLRASAFLFHSPTDGDGHLRLGIDYLLDDAWTVSAGANLFYGPPDTAFGQFRDAANVVAALRYGF